MIVEGKKTEGPESNALKRDLMENFPHLVFSPKHPIFHIVLNSLPIKAQKKPVYLTISQSLKGLEKCGLQLPLPSEELHTSLTQASLTRTKANEVGKETQRGESPHQLSFQNFTLCLFPTSKESLLLTCHSLLIAFHNPTPYPPLTSLEHQPPCSSPNFPLIT